MRIGGSTVPHDPLHRDGWDFSDASQTMITIYGTSCDAVTRGDSVTIVFLILI